MPNLGSKKPQRKSHKTKIKTKIKMLFKSIILAFISFYKLWRLLYPATQKVEGRGTLDQPAISFQVKEETPLKESFLSSAGFVSVSADGANYLVAFSFQLGKMTKGTLLSLY
jgi:hypothetical protein